MAFCDMRTLVVVSFFNPDQAQAKQVLDSLWAEAYASGIGIVAIDDGSTPSLDLRAYSDDGHYPIMQTGRNVSRKGAAATFRDVVGVYAQANHKIKYVGTLPQDVIATPGMFAQQAKLLDENFRLSSTSNLVRVPRQPVAP